MTNKLELTEVFAGHSIRIVGTPEAPLFIAKDVCDVLGISNSRGAVDSLEEDEKGVALTDTQGGQQNMQAITESGLYALIFKSRKQEAKMFRKWVTSEVMPAIRKTGSYSVHAAPMTLPTHSEALRGWANALEANEAQAAQIEAQAASLAIAAPKVVFCDTVMASETICQMAVGCQVAQLPFGRNTLYQKLREKGVLITDGNRHNLPTQKYVDRGLFVVKEKSFEHPKTGDPIVTFTTYCTQKGVDWLIKNFSETSESLVEIDYSVE